MSEKIANVTLENIRIIFKNFAGKAGNFNPEGRRSFCAIIPKDLAMEMLSEGWNIKTLNPRDPDDEPEYYVQVRVNFGQVPPKIYMVTGHNKTLLDEDTISNLDYAEINNVDLVIRPYCWEMNNKTGVTAYVKTMYVTIEEDEFSSKYDYEEDEVPFN